MKMKEDDDDKADEDQASTGQRPTAAGFFWAFSGLEQVGTVGTSCWFIDIVGSWWPWLGTARTAYSIFVGTVSLHQYSQ